MWPVDEALFMINKKIVDNFINNLYQINIFYFFMEFVHNMLSILILTLDKDVRLCAGSRSGLYGNDILYALDSP